MFGILTRVRFLLRCGLALASALTVLTALAAADAVDGGTKALLIAGYGHRCAAALHPSAENRATMASSVSPDFIILKPNGRLSDQGDLIDESLATSRGYRVTACTYRLRSFALSDPDTIVLTSELQMQAKLLGADDHQVTASQQSQDTWIRSSQVWVLRLIALSRVVVKVDGNVLQDLHS